MSEMIDKSSNEANPDVAKWDVDAGRVADPQLAETMAYAGKRSEEDAAWREENRDNFQQQLGNIQQKKEHPEEYVGYAPTSEAEEAGVKAAYQREDTAARADRERADKAYQDVMDTFDGNKNQN